MARYFIGTSGWHYVDWQGRFYPEKLPKAKWLEFYSRRFSTVELNNSFYHLPTENAFTKWYSDTPAGFIFALKASRFITHIRRLKDIGEAEETLINRARLLGEKLGPLLYQLPPNLHRDDDLLESFLSGLPEGLKHVVEFRHRSWLDREVFNILSKYKTGLCIFDMPEMSSPAIATADFAYVRFHGSEAMFSSRYTDDELADWAGKIEDIAANVEAVYIYFNNDVSGFAIENASTIGNYLEGCQGS